MRKAKPRKHTKPRWGFGVRKAMNLNEAEDAPSSERRILGGIENEPRQRQSPQVSGCWNWENKKGMT